MGYQVWFEVFSQMRPIGPVFDNIEAASNLIYDHDPDGMDYAEIRTTEGRIVGDSPPTSLLRKTRTSKTNWVQEGF